jgi:hypothetical protein
MSKALELLNNIITNSQNVFDNDVTFKNDVTVNDLKINSILRKANILQQKTVNTIESDSAAVHALCKYISKNNDLINDVPTSDSIILNRGMPNNKGMNTDMNTQEAYISQFVPLSTQKVEVVKSLHFSPDFDETNPIHTGLVSNQQLRIVEPVNYDATKNYPLLLFVENTYVDVFAELVKRPNFTNAFGGSALEDGFFMVQVNHKATTVWGDFDAVTSAERGTFTYQSMLKTDDETDDELAVGFYNFLLYEAIPFLKGKYPNMMVDRDNIILAGSSYGASLALNIGLRFPHFARNFYVHEPSDKFIDPTVYQFPNLLKKYLPLIKEADLDLWIVWKSAYQSLKDTRRAATYAADMKLNFSLWSQRFFETGAQFMVDSGFNLYPAMDSELGIKTEISDVTGKLRLFFTDSASDSNGHGPISIADGLHEGLFKLFGTDAAVDFSLPPNDSNSQVVTYFNHANTSKLISIPQDWGQVGDYKVFFYGGMLYFRFLCGDRYVRNVRFTVKRKSDSSVISVFTPVYQKNIYLQAVSPAINGGRFFDQVEIFDSSQFDISQISGGAAPGESLTEVHAECINFNGDVIGVPEIVWLYG